MDEKELLRIINSRPNNRARRRWNCPSDIQVASYLEQRLEPTERSHFEAHLADCDFCLAMVGELVPQQSASDPVDVPARLLRQAIDSVPVQATWRISLRRWALVPALASIVVAGAVLLRSPQARHFMPSASVPREKAGPSVAAQPSAQSQEEKDIRGSNSSPALQLLEPRSESVVQREGLKFRWQPMGDVAYYEIRVMDSQGDLVWQAQRSNPSAQVPSNVSIQPGKYFVSVHAYLKDGRTVRSDSVAIIVGGSS